MSSRLKWRETGRGICSMKSFEEIKEIISQSKPIFQEEYKVKEIGIFGSYVRGEQNEDSDVDVLIAFEKPPSLLKFVELENYLSETIGIKVDLVMKQVLKPRIGENILAEVIYL
jgi:predicted nucleotidyltransferase